MRVRVGRLYRYEPIWWDIFFPCAGNTLKSGDIVRVIELPNAPKANTAGHCYVGDAYSGVFICMVCTRSLTPVKAVRP